MNSLDDKNKTREVKRRPGGRAEKMVARVHQVTYELLQTITYEDIEIPEIARLAEINKTSIYRRWNTKLELVLEVSLARIRTDVPLPDSGKFETDLQLLLRNIAKSLETPFVKNLLRAWISYTDPEIQKAKDHFWKERFELASPIIQRAVERGELAQRTSSRDLLEMAAAPLFYNMMVLGRENTTQDIDVIVHRIFKIFKE